MNSNHFRLAGLLMLALSGCAWVPSQTEPKGASEGSEAATAEPSPNVQIEWSKEEGYRNPVPLLVAEHGELSGGYSVTMPSDIPEVARFKLEAPFVWDGKSSISLKAIALTGIAGKPQALRTREEQFNLTQGGGTSGLTVEFSLENLKTILSSNEEQSALLAVELLGDDGRIGKFTLSLRSPASKIEVSDLPAYTLEEMKQLPRQLSNQSRRLELIRVFSFKNRSTEAIQVNLPVRLKGSAEHTVARYQNGLSGGFGETLNCSYRSEIANQAELLTARLYLLAQEDGIERTWSARVREEVSERGGIELAGGETRLVGMYAEGDRAAALTQRTIATDLLTEKTVAAECRFECELPSVLSAPFRQQCGAIDGNGDSGFSKGAACEVRVEDCAAFLTAVGTHEPRWTAKYKALEQQCGSAFFWSMESTNEGLDASWRMSGCESGWKKSVTRTERVLEGVISHPAWIHIDGVSTVMQLSYADDARNRPEAPVREVTFMREEIQQTE